MATETTPPKQTIKANEEKWTPKLMQAGWTSIPSVLIDRQQALGLEPIDMNILLVLAKHWWVKDRLPYPSKTTMATSIGVSPRHVQRRIAFLEKANFIKRVKRFDKDRGQTSNQYDLTGLIEAAQQFAEEAIELKHANTEAKKQRLHRKKPLKTPGKRVS